VIPFYLAAAVAVAATGMAITRREAIHALLYLIVSLLSVAVIFYLLGAPFMAALEVIVYAGAIMVLLVFVVMLLNGGPAAAGQEHPLSRPGMWLGPSLLALLLVAELAALPALHPGGPTREVPVKEVALALYGRYLIGVELASFLLLAALVGAYHLGHASRREPQR
jgi:NADH-quinone oxidoreductase subunit J